MGHLTESARAWWYHDLLKFEQYELCKKYYPSKKPHMLENSEILNIWMSE